MNWISRWIGPPTPLEMARRVMDSAVRRGLADGRLSARGDELRGQIGGRPVSLHLGNLFVDYCATPRSRRAALIDGFLASLLSEAADDAVPAAYGTARPRLMPVVRTLDDIGIARLAIHHAGSPAGPASLLRTLPQPVSAAALAELDHAQDRAVEHAVEHAVERAVPATRPLVGELVVALVYDAPATMGYVTAERLAAWGVDFDRAYADALDNLRARPEHPGWVEVAHGVWSGEWGDSYESSRLLLPELIARRGIVDPMALVPFRGSLLVASGRDPLAPMQMAAIVHAQLEHRPRRLSFRLLQLEGRDWQPLPPDREAGLLFDALRRRHRAGAYASQKTLLEDLHQRRGTDVFVASYSVAECEGRPPFSLAVWSEGVDSLLPEAEVVMLRPRRRGDGAPAHLPVRWADLQAIAGGLMERAELQPPRYRVRAFPDEAALQALQRCAVSL